VLLPVFIAVPVVVVVVVMEAAFIAAVGAVVEKLFAPEVEDFAIALPPGLALSPLELTPFKVEVEVDVAVKV
jgi:hypothetical protein